MNAKLASGTLIVLCLALVVPAQAAAPRKNPESKSALSLGPVIEREPGRVLIPVGTAPSLVKCAARVGPALPITAVAFSPDGKLLAAADGRSVVLWDLENVKLLKRLGAGQLGSVHALAFTKDGKQLAVGEGAPGVSGSVKFFDPASGQPGAAFTGPKDVVFSLAISDQAKLLAAGSADGRAYVWNRADGKLATTIEVHGDWVMGVAFSPDGKLLATGGADRSVQVWEVGAWKSAKRFAAKDPVTATIFSPDGELLVWGVAGAQSGMLGARIPLDPPQDEDPKKRKEIPQPRQIGLDEAAPLGLAYGPKSFYVACADKTVKVFAANLTQSATMTGHGDWVYCVAVGADGKRLATGSADGTVKLWGDDNRPLATLVQLAPDKDEWLVLTTPGYFATSTPDAVTWDKMGLTTEPDKLKELFASPDKVRDVFAGKAVQPPALK